MRIIIAGSINAYGLGEEEAIVRSLSEALKKKENKVDFFLLPFSTNAMKLQEQILAYSDLDMSAAELLITVGYPACFLRHSNKVSYLLETMPSLHEYWDTEYGVLGNNQYSGVLVSSNEAEKKCLAEAKRVFSATALLSEDLFKRTGLSVSVLHYPDFFNKNDEKEKSGKMTGFVTESCLLQNSRCFELAELIRKTDSTLTVFVPNADKMVFEAFERVISGEEFGKRIKVVKRSISFCDIIASDGYIDYTYESRRVDRGIYMSADEGAPILLSKNAGAAGQMLEKYSNALFFDESSFGSIIANAKKTGKKKLMKFAVDADEFAGRLVN